jgi:hypothetical protein
VCELKFHAFLTSQLHKDEWSASRSSYFTLGEEPLVLPAQEVFDGTCKQKNHYLHLELNPGRPAYGQSLYCLNNPCSQRKNDDDDAM